MRTLFLFAIALIAFSRVGIAGDFVFKPTRYPFLPILTTNTDDAVCRAFLGALTAGFKGTADVLFGPWDGAEWLLPVADQGAGVRAVALPLASGKAVPQADDDEDGTSVFFLEADVDGDGRNEVLAMSRSNFNWVSRGYALMLFPSRAAFDAALKTAKSAEDLFPQAIDIAPRAGWGSFGDAKSAFSERPDFALVHVNGRYYTLEHPNYDDTHYSLLEVATGAPPSSVCSAIAAPANDPGGMGPLGGTPVAHLVDILKSISGTEGRNGGTMHAHSQLLADAAALQGRLALRHWAIKPVEPYIPYNSRVAVEADIGLWSDASLFNFRQARALGETIPVAIDALSRFYTDAFGLAPADSATAAQAAIDLLIRAYFVFPSGGIKTPPNTAYRGLTRALLHGAPRGRILELLKSGAKIRTHFTQGTDGELGEDDWGYFVEEPTLFYSLENPGNVALLLDRGADANVKGNFGKTALMYAAQFDLVETAKVLLVYGADPNAATDNGPSSDDALINRTHRTVLMYAAENAGPEMIRLLLAHGADPRARDTSDRGVVDYLEMNDSLSPQDRAAIIAELAKAP